MIERVGRLRNGHGIESIVGTALTAAACGGIAYSYYEVGNGIALSGGAWFALMLALAALADCMLLLFIPAPPVIRRLLGLALAGCLLGAAACAYFLEATVPLTCLLFAIAFWLMTFLLPLGRSSFVSART